MKPLPVETLESVLQHGAVAFSEDVTAHLDGAIAAHPDQVPVESAMVDLAKGEPVGNSWPTIVIAVGNDVGGIQELPVPVQQAVPGGVAARYGRGP